MALNCLQFILQLHMIGSKKIDHVVRCIWFHLVVIFFTLTGILIFYHSLHQLSANKELLPAPSSGQIHLIITFKDRGRTQVMCCM